MRTIKASSLLTTRVDRESRRKAALPDASSSFETRILEILFVWWPRRDTFWEIDRALLSRRETTVVSDSGDSGTNVFSEGSATTGEVASEDNELFELEGVIL